MLTKFISKMYLNYSFVTFLKVIYSIKGSINVSKVYLFSMCHYFVINTLKKNLFSYVNLKFKNNNAYKLKPEINIIITF